MKVETMGNVCRVDWSGAGSRGLTWKNVR